jgi:hypothetical protein
VRYLGWRLLSVLLAFTAALVLPLVCLVVVTGLLRTGIVGTVGFFVWVAAMVVVVKVTVRRRRA